MSAGIRAGSSNDGYVQVNGNDIITALSGGNVGIGNTSPSTKLHVNGTVTATAFAGAVTGTSSGNPTLANGSNNRVITATGSNALTGEVAFTFDGSTATINGNTTDTPLILTSTSNNGSHMRFQKDGANKHFIGCGGGFTLGDVDDLSFRTVDNIIFGVGTSEKVRITGAGKLSVKSSAANAVYLSLVDNDSANEIWRVGQASDGDGYVEVLEDGGTVGCKLDASGNSFTMGNFGVGVASPGTKLTVSGGVHITSTANTSKNVDGCIIERSSSDGIVHIAACRTGGNYTGLNFYVAGDSGGSGANTTLRHIIDYQGNFKWYGSDGTTQRMRISNTGQVGIGMDPIRKFEVKDSTNANRIMNIRGTGTSGAFLAFLDANTTDDSRARVGSKGGNNISLRGDEHHFEKGSDGSHRMLLDSTGNIHLRSASTNRIVLGSQGGTVGVLTNNENWIRGSGTMLQLNTAGGDYGFEVLGSQKMKLDSSGNLELRSATQTRITFGSAGGSGNDTAWIRGDGDDLMFNVRTGGDFKWEMNGSLVAELTTAKKVQGILVGKREYTVSMPAHTTWYYVCTVHSQSLCSQVEFRINGTRDSTVFNAHFDVLSTHAAPQYHVTSTGCNYTAVYMKFVGNNYGAYNAYIKRSGTTGACDANVRVYPRMNEYIDESEDSGYSSTAFEVTGFSGKRIWSSTASNADLDVHGSITGASKSFKIPHPLTSLKDAKRLVHASIEGPSCDLIYRGTATLSSGSATVNIDTVAGMTAGTFAALNKNVQCFTTNESGWGAVKGSVSGNTLTITAQDGSSTDNVSWMVVGQRQDDTIKELDSTDANGDLVLEPSIDPTEASPSDSYPSDPSQYDSSQ